MKKNIRCISFVYLNSHFGLLYVVPTEELNPTSGLKAGKYKFKFKSKKKKIFPFWIILTKKIIGLIQYNVSFHARNHLVNFSYYPGLDLNVNFPSFAKDLGCEF